MTDEAPPSPLPRGARVTLAVIAALALALRCVIALRWPNRITPDEIYQYLEQAHRLVFGYGLVPWEYTIGIRSWLVPGVLAAVMRLTQGLLPGSQGYLAGCELFLCLLSLNTVVVAFLLAYRRFGLLPAAVAGAACGLWSDLLFFAPKPLTEVLAAHALLPGLYLLVGPASRRRLRTAGALCGLALVLRVHLSPAIVAGLYLACRHDLRARLRPVASGFLASLLLAGLLDAVTWTYPFQSLWLNAWVNVVQGASQDYGVAPWYVYLTSLWGTWWLGAPLLALLVALGARRWPAALAVAVLVVATHSLLKHKEFRFIYPALALLIVLAAQGLAELTARAPRRARWPMSLALVLAWGGLSALAAQRFSAGKVWVFTLPPDQDLSLWQVRRDGTLILGRLSREDGICGLGLLQVPWYYTGGYTYLHHPVHIYDIQDDQDLRERAHGFNVLLAARLPGGGLGPYRDERCLGELCTYRRPGPCEVTSGTRRGAVLDELLR